VYIVIAIILLIIFSFIFFTVGRTFRGLKTARCLHAFLTVYNALIAQGQSKDYSLYLAFQGLRRAPKYNILTNEDIKMIVETLSVLNEPEKIIEKFVLKFDCKRASLMLKDPVTVSKLAQIAQKYE
jgi:hypothetical protein